MGTARSAGHQPSTLDPRPSTLDPHPSTLLQYEAARLFLERAVCVQPRFAVTAANAPAIASVCERLDGIPLAIELAAARVRVLPVEQIAGRLDERFRLLVGSGRSVPPRQQTLRATLDWSFDLLTEAERTLLRRLSIFRGGWTLEAAEAVCGDEGCWVLGVGSWDSDAPSQDPTPNTQHLTPDEVLDLLQSLIDKSLVLLDESQDEGRYRLLETIREYGGEKLWGAAEAAELGAKHAGWYLALAEQAEGKLQGPRQAEWLARLEREHDNLRAALEWCLSVGSRQSAVGSEDPSGLPTAYCLLPTGPEAGLRLGAALWRFWSVRGYLREGRERLAALLAHPEAAARTPARAGALNSAGSLAWSQGDYDAARALHEESLVIRRELGDRSGIAHALHDLGIVAKDQGDYDSARALYEESLAIRRELGDTPGIAYSLNNLGNLARSQGEYDAAAILYQQSLALKQELGDDWGIASSLNNLGVVAQERGDYDAARALHEESLAIKRKLGDRSGIGYSLHNLGNIALSQGDYEAARGLHAECLAIRRELGEQYGIAASLNNLGWVAQKQGEYGTARALHEESLAIKRKLGDKPGIAYSLGNLGGVARDQGDYEAAQDLLGQGLALLSELGDRRVIASSLDGHAALAVAREQWERAVRLCGAVAALREEMGTPRPSSEAAQVERRLADTRAALGEEAFAAGWAQGRAMTLQQAVAYALESKKDPGAC